MDSGRGAMRSTATALILAIGAAGLAGYLISRPQGPVGDPRPNPYQAPTPNGPFSTDGYSVADDPATNQVLVFGGTRTLTETWVWCAGHWEFRHPRTSPTGREEAATAYDPQLHMVLLFGGIRPPETGLSDTWGWDGTEWRKLDSGFNGPPPGEAAMAWDPAVNAMVLVSASSSGADTWTWSGTHWIDHRARDPYLPTGVLDLAFDPAAHALMAAGFGNVVGPGVGARVETWTWDGTAWRQIITSHTPSAYGILGLRWDPVTARLLLFGQGPTLVPMLRWVWTGTDWERLAPVTRPSIIQGLVTSADTAKLRLVGEVSAPQGAITPIDIWAWTGSAWKLENGS
jgi:hypothetical protein